MTMVPFSSRDWPPREGGSREHGGPKPAKLLGRRSRLRAWHQDGGERKQLLVDEMNRKYEGSCKDEWSDGCFDETSRQPPVGSAEVSWKKDGLREQSFEAEERRDDLQKDEDVPQ